MSHFVLLHPVYSCVTCATLFPMAFKNTQLSFRSQEAEIITSINCFQNVHFVR